MIYQKLRANVWDEVAKALDEEDDLLWDKIKRAVDRSSSWREEITLELTPVENKRVLQIIEEEDLNTE